MEQILIIYPALAMFLETFMLLSLLGFSRYRAIHGGEVSIEYYEKYTEGQETDRLHILGRHVQNHFEVPPLFHIGVIFLYVTDSVTLISVIAAWAFVLIRFIHTFIHLGKNNVSQRFFCFGLSLMALLVMWASLFIKVLGGG